MRKLSSVRLSLKKPKTFLMRHLVWGFAWASKGGGGEMEDASPAAKKSAGDVPPKVMIFRYLFS